LPSLPRIVASPGAVAGAAVAGDAVNGELDADEILPSRRGGAVLEGAGLRWVAEVVTWSAVTV
jgi:hypothetical protein